MVMGYNTSLMETNTKENIKMVNFMVKEDTLGLMDHFIKGGSKMVVFQVNTTHGSK